MQPPIRMTVLRIHSLPGTIPDDVSKLVHLKELSIRGYAAGITDAFFKDMHQLEVVKLVVNRTTNSDPFSDSGFKILLQNNPNLKEVTLCRFPLTDRSLMHLIDHVNSHGILDVSLTSTDSSAFSIAAVNMVQAAVDKWKAKP
jgi:hypothetical protein